MWNFCNEKKDRGNCCRLYVFYLMFVLPFLGGVLTSCEKEFSPNAEWKEIPSVFCLLDQDDDTTYVRLQRCYLGEGNLYEYGSISDSIYYPDGVMEVLIKVWRSELDMLSGNATPFKVMDFTCELRNKVEGDFASGLQPIYCHRNVPGELDSAYVYELIVRRVNDGTVVATATTRLLGDPSATYGWLKTPSPVSGNGRVTFNMMTGASAIRWIPVDRGRLYQPSVRFYYRYRFAPDSLRYIDVHCESVKATSQQSLEMNTLVEKGYYLGEIAKALQADTNHKLFVDTVAIIMDVADESLNAYIAVTTAIDRQNYQMYNNITGGVGLFAARRTHLMEYVLSDKGDQPTGMHTLLENLGVGFQQSDL